MTMKNFGESPDNWPLTMDNGKTYKERYLAGARGMGRTREVQESSRIDRNKDLGVCRG